MTPDILGMGAALGLNAAALVWGAAKMSASVQQLGKTVDKLELFLEKVDGEVANHAVRLSILEERTREERLR